MAGGGGTTAKTYSLTMDMGLGISSYMERTRATMFRGAGRRRHAARVPVGTPGERRFSDVKESGFPFLSQHF